MAGNGSCKVMDRRGLHPDLNVFTTGQIRKLCNVSARTASKWFDTGLLTGVRLPGARDRRVYRSSLLQFLGDNGFVEELGYLTRTTDRPLVGVTVLVGLEPKLAEAVATVCPATVTAADLFQAGYLCCRSRPKTVVIDAAAGRPEAWAAGEVLSKWGDPPPFLVVLIGDDQGDDGYWHAAGFGVVLRRPVGAERLAAALRGTSKCY